MAAAEKMVFNNGSGGSSGRSGSGGSGNNRQERQCSMAAMVGAFDGGGSIQWRSTPMAMDYGKAMVR